MALSCPTLDFVPRPVPADQVNPLLALIRVDAEHTLDSVPDCGVLARGDCCFRHACSTRFHEFKVARLVQRLRILSCHFWLD